MYRLAFRVVVVAVAVSVGGCALPEERGGPGERCLPNGTCNPGLVCDKTNTCVEAGAEDGGEPGGDTGSSHDATSEPDGHTLPDTGPGRDTGVLDAGEEDWCRGETTGYPCPGGVCVEEGGGGTGCWPVCTVPGDACEYGSCYSLGIPGEFACLPTGTRATGEPCVAVNDCVAGATCLDADGLTVCWRFCDETNPCPGNEFCTGTGLGFMVCVVCEDCCAEEGQDCTAVECCPGLTCGRNGRCRALETLSISGTVTDFQTKQPVADAFVELLDDDSGIPLGIGGVSDYEGSIVLRGIEAGVARVGVRVGKSDNMDTVQYHFAAGAQGEAFYIVSETTASLIGGILGITLDPSKGFAVGGVYWGDRFDETPVGCAIVTNSPAGGEEHYMDNSGIPTKSRDARGTNPTNGFFMILNMNPGRIVITADANGKRESVVLPDLPADSVAVSHIYFDRSKYPSNPQPPGCQ
ncbi:MAG: carboxypeptidase regulatory-like domain-containing protein [Deltaproteobacteria bacterium]|nr:carboxypeptidase regulatory-like domain-containing protein [Deltaproteobacteria bacterium]